MSQPQQHREQIAFLRTVQPFADLREADLTALLEDFRPRVYRKDQIIFHQGDDSRTFYVIVKGKVRIFRITPSGDETSINLFSTADIIGEFAALDELPRSASAKAVTKSCTLLEMSQDNFLGHMRNMPGLGLGMSRFLTGKVRWTAAYAEAMAQFDAAARLLHLLLLHKEQFGQEIEAGHRYVLDLGLTQTDLASHIGVQREYVNRLLQEWRQRGLIEFKAGRLTILDLPAVRQERDRRIQAHNLEW